MSVGAGPAGLAAAVYGASTGADRATINRAAPRTRRGPAGVSLAAAPRILRDSPLVSIAATRLSHRFECSRAAGRAPRSQSAVDFERPRADGTGLVGRP